MNRTSSYSEEISQTALALLALVAAGQSLDASTIRSLRSLLCPQNDSSESLVPLTVFSDSDYDDEEMTELPDIIPFADWRPKVNPCSNGYGTLSLKNQTSASRAYPKLVGRCFTNANEIANNVSGKAPDQFHNGSKDMPSWPRIFSPDVATSPDEDDTPCLATSSHSLRIYAE